MMRMKWTAPAVELPSASLSQLNVRVSLVGSAMASLVLSASLLLWLQDAWLAIFLALTAFCIGFVAALLGTVVLSPIAIWLECLPLWQAYGAVLILSSSLGLLMGLVLGPISSWVCPLYGFVTACVWVFYDTRRVCSS